MIYGITIKGCDDSTKFNIELNDMQLAAALRLADQSADTSTYDCQPVMAVGHAHTPEDDDDE